MKKINLKQGKYILPLVILVPLVMLIYFVSSLFAGESTATAEVKQEGLNPELPAPKTERQQRKMASMERGYTQEEPDIEEISAEDQEAFQAAMELEAKMMEEEAAQRQAMADLEASLAQSRRMVYEAPAPQSYNSYDDTYEMELERARRQRTIDSIVNPEKYQPKETPVEEEKRQESPAPLLVIKSRSENRERFNTITSEDDASNSPLIRALIDQTTKATQDSRLRFKLLDDIQVKGTTIPKGTYLYGTVSGFTQQRVRANISSIMVDDTFLKVNLSVFDVDGMEGFYVPESAFREFMKDAASGAVSQNININTGYGSGISGESLALQALQNIYSSATNAISSNIRKNRAKIKYSTVVYLINSEDAR